MIVFIPVILILVALFILFVLSLPCVVYSLLSMIWNRCDKATYYKYFYRIALACDELGNTICSRPFNDILIYKDNKDSYHFGLDGETVSSVIGKNVERGTLRWPGKALNWLLDKIQKNHSVLSVNNNLNNTD